ncbi:MAG TPA: hypothetical protein VFA11_03065 [Acidimicrobiales bacterium]|nr:hypothetical protein [Acidimicrobiales bacterium]
MVPPYRPPEPVPSTRLRRTTAAALIGAAVTAVTVGTVAWSLQPSPPPLPAGCVTVTMASTTGGINVRRCGSDAVAWCAQEKRSDPLYWRVAEECRRLPVAAAPSPSPPG